MMKIYTRTGDDGTTSLIGGRRVPKHDTRVEAYGTVDELIAYLGYIRDQLENKDDKETLQEIQGQLMICAAIIAKDCDDCQVKVPHLEERDTRSLEEKINQYEGKLEKLDAFLLPGGHPLVSLSHVARNVCRRAERNALKANEEHGFSVLVLKYLNRLSDFLFVLGRKFSSDLGVKEIKWNPKR